MDLELPQSIDQHTGTVEFQHLRRQRMHTTHRWFLRIIALMGILSWVLAFVEIRKDIQYSSVFLDWDTSINANYFIQLDKIELSKNDVGENVVTHLSIEEAEIENRFADGLRDAPKRSNRSDSLYGMLENKIVPENKQGFDHEIISLYTVPDSPDLSIGADLRSMIRADETKISSSHAIEKLDTKAVENNPLRKCSPTSQVRISKYNTDYKSTNSSLFSNTNNRPWIIEALDEHGNKKSVGGDEFYITYTDNKRSMCKNERVPTAVARYNDNEDGTYVLDFIAPHFGCTSNEVPTIAREGLNGTGSLTIHILFTCGIGRMTRPSKDEWDTGGYLHRKEYYVTNITAPSIRETQRPNILANGTRVVDLSKYDRVVCFGDSIMENMCGSFHEKSLFTQPNLIIKHNFGSIIRSDTLEMAFNKFEEIYGSELRLEKKREKEEMVASTAIIIGSATWEILSNKGPLPGHYFKNSLQMYYDLVNGVRSRYPTAVIYWKSPQAFHHTALTDQCDQNPGCKARTRYASPSNFEYLYKEQKRIMKELNVKFLDVYEASYLSEPWHIEGDGGHFRDWFNMYLLDSFYPRSMKLLKKY